MIINYNSQLGIKYLSKKRFQGIFNLISTGKPSWEIIGEDLFGKGISKEEFAFVYSKGGFSLNE